MCEFLRAILRVAGRGGSEARASQVAATHTGRFGSGRLDRATQAVWARPGDGPPVSGAAISPVFQSR
jgi:hypothetical protein